jgi:MbtH protein
MPGVRYLWSVCCTIINETGNRNADMSETSEESDGTFRVLVNYEAQYALWPAFAEIPEGWKGVLEERVWETCRDYIEREWTDMRPASLMNTKAEVTA